ncbi:MAG: hypothetical protein HGA19_00590 [Oscillochloris sp.]|nr:hypothetical protein [Oscillochloris sp.]
MSESLPETTARLLAKVLHAGIAEDVFRFGVLARRLPSFDPFILCRELAPDLAEQRCLLALIGFVDTTLAMFPGVATMVEQAVEWRNNDQITVPVLVFVNPLHMPEKIHSLELLEPFEDTDLRQAVCREGLRSQPQNKLIWSVLLRRDVARFLPLVASQVISYYALLQGGTAIGDALSSLGLIPDPALTRIMDNREQFINRIKLNRIHVQWLLALEQQENRALARAIQGNKHQQTFSIIQEYIQQPSSAILERLTLDAVDALFKARRPEKLSMTALETKNLSGAEAPSNKDVEPLPLDLLVLDRTTQHTIDQRPEIKELIDEEINWFREDPSSDQRPVRNDVHERPKTAIADGQEVTIAHPIEKQDIHPLEDGMRLWVQIDRWGGIVRTSDDHASLENIRSLPQLVLDAAALAYTPFNPFIAKQNDTSGQSLLSMFSALEQFIDEDDVGDNHLAQLLTTFGSLRHKLAAYRTLFLYRPVVATASDEIFEQIAAYIETFERLLNRLRHIYPAAVDLFDTIEQATSQLLALDVVIIDRPGHEAALLTTLHPLYLWQWLELARRMRANTEPLSLAEQRLLQERVKHLPALLNTLQLHPSMLLTPRHIDEPRLVLAGSITVSTSQIMVGVPYYQPIARQGISLDGFQEFKELLIQFLALYPPSRIGLFITLVDPPALRPILSACATLYNRGVEPLLHGVRIQVYRTRPQVFAYDTWQTEDNDILALYRDHPRWTFSIHPQYISYTDIVNQIQKSGTPHITLLCDPSESVVQPILRTSQGAPSPFDIPIHLTYDSFSDRVRLTPAPGGGLFDIYAGIRNALTGELNRRTLGVGHTYVVSADDLDKLVDLCTWLMVIDRPNGTLEMPTTAQRIAWNSFETRTRTIYTRDQERWRNHFIDHRLDPGIIDQYIDDTLAVVPNGLLTTISTPPLSEHETTHQALRPNAFEQLQGIMSLVYWYRAEQDSIALVDISTSAFTDWFGSVSARPQLATLLLVARLKKDQVLFDLVAMQAYQDPDLPLPSLAEAQPYLQHLSICARTLEQLFAPATETTLIGPIRRELLRAHLSMAIFAPTHHKTNTQPEERGRNKSKWASAINALFTGYTPQIHLSVIRVALQSTARPDSQSLGSDRFHQYPASIITLPGIARLASISRSLSNGKDGQVEQGQSPIGESGVSLDDQITTPTFVDSDTEQRTEESVSQEVSLISSMPKPKDIEEQAEQLRRALVEYGIAVAGIDIERTQIGPRIIRYWVRLQPPAGRLAEVQKYATDLARELGSKSVPLIDNIPGEKYIGIDLAREQPEIVPLMPALQQLPQNQPSSLLITMGVDAAGNGVQADLVRLPHLLVAGSTGSGKTMFLLGLITSLIWQHQAAELELLLVDPKQTDFVMFERLPHLREGRVFYEPSEAIEALQLITGTELDRRTKLLREAGCPNNLEYNRRHPNKRLSWITIIIDEFADIMITLSRTRREEFERQIGRLAAIGRSKGIHLVIATQRPTTDIITGTLKANIPGRVSFRLPSGTDSRTILDRTGAENLLGNGDMLALLDGAFQRLQGYYAPFDEIERLLTTTTH